MVCLSCSIRISVSEEVAMTEREVLLPTGVTTEETTGRGVGDRDGEELGVGFGVSEGVGAVIGVMLGIMDDGVVLIEGMGVGDGLWLGESTGVAMGVGVTVDDGRRTVCTVTIALAADSLPAASNALI